MVAHQKAGCIGDILPARQLDAGIEEFYGGADDAICAAGESPRRGKEGHGTILSCVFYIKEQLYHDPWGDSRKGQ